MLMFFITIIVINVSCNSSLLIVKGRTQANLCSVIPILLGEGLAVDHFDKVAVF